MVKVDEPDKTRCLHEHVMCSDGQLVENARTDVVQIEHHVVEVARHDFVLELQYSFANL